MTKNNDLKKLLNNIQDFVSKRDWERHHSPKNVAMALSVEVSELVEIFQWMSEEETKNIEGKTKSHIEEEVGDVLIYLTILASKFNIDPVAAAEKKMALNKIKYPIKGESS